MHKQTQSQIDDLNLAISIVLSSLSNKLKRRVYPYQDLALLEDYLTDLSILGQKDADKENIVKQLKKLYQHIETGKNSRLYTITPAGIDPNKIRDYYPGQEINVNDRSYLVLGIVQKQLDDMAAMHINRAICMKPIYELSKNKLYNFVYLVPQPKVDHHEL